MKKTALRKYAHLVAKMGVNVQKGQEVFISAEFDQPEFVQMVVEECYKLGAKTVIVDWTYQPLGVVNVKYRSVKTLSELSDWEEARLKHYVDKIPCRIYIESEDPDGMKKMNMKKYAQAMQNKYPKVKPYNDALQNKYQWCIVAVPGAKWAKKLFPELSKKQAMEKLWEKIFMCARIDDDPVLAWEKHNEDIHKREEYLNSLNIKSLHYTSKNGTDFTVGLIDEGQFCGGDEKSLSGISFNPNIPSEEIFTSPKKGEAEGIVYATKPLCYNGILIEDFWIRFKDGKAVEWDAKKNKEVLTTLLTMDESSSYLGECALVPYDSPIQNSGVLFYNTLFDENAACHLAVGRGFNDCIKGFETKTNEECRELGINDSMVHSDFMIGSEDLCIEATTKEGKKVQIFKNGNWAF